MRSSPVSVLIVDDQDLIRDALAALLALDADFRVAGHARNGVEAVALAAELRPDVILMDVRMPGLSGPEATSRIKRNPALRGTRVLVLTTFEEADVARACVAAGADGFLGKGVSTASLRDAIHAVMRGEAPFSPRAARAVLAPRLAPRAGVGDVRDAPTAGLTDREVDIAKLVALGLTNEEIGRRLSISAATVKTHLRNAMRKLHVHSRAHLVALAHRTGLAP